MKKLAIIITHPIQYYAPVFRLLHARRVLEIKVFYTWGEESIKKFDPGFDQTIAWDIPLLEGYPYEWVKNTASDKGSHHFRGIINPGLIARIRLWNPDALLIYGWAYQSHLEAIHYFKNKMPIFFRGDSTLLNQPPGIKKWLKYLFLTWVYEQVDQALFVGTNNKAYFRYYGMKQEQLSFVPHAIENERFSENRSAEATSLRQSLNIADQEILILYAGKFNARKNVTLLLNAFLALNSSATHLLLAGSGSCGEQLRAQAKESGLANQIHFMDFQNQSDMPVIYQASDLFCLPSVEETWGLAINEAMACATAVLAADRVGCAIDLIEEGFNGFVFETGSLASLTAHLKDLIRMGRPGLKEMGRHSKKIIDHWTFLTQVALLEAAVFNHE